MKRGCPFLGVRAQRAVGSKRGPSEPWSGSADFSKLSEGAGAWAGIGRVGEWSRRKGKRVAPSPVEQLRKLHASSDCVLVQGKRVALRGKKVPYVSHSKRTTGSDAFALDRNCPKACMSDALHVS